MRRKQQSKSGRVKHSFYVEHGSDNTEYEVFGSALLVHDSNYGADADGNRGVPMDWVDDVELELGADAEKLPQADQYEILKKAEKLEEGHDWYSDYEPYDYPDYDPYDN